MRLFRAGHFREAHDCFQAALERVDSGDQPVLYFDLNYNLAKTLQHRGEHRQAIKIFEASRIADGRRYIRYEHGIASSNCKLGNYTVSIQQFTRITEKYRHCKKDLFYYECKLGIAICHAMLNDYGEALKLLRALTREDPDNRAIYLKEVEHLKLRLDEELVLNSGRRFQRLDSDSTALRPATEIRIEGDPQLCELLSSIVTEFPEIRLPIKAVYVEKRDNHPSGLKKLGASNNFVPISQGHRDHLGHVLIYNREFWSGASVPALRGNLAHELMHRAWEDSRAERLFFSWTKDTLTYGCLERIIDLCVMAKGFVEDIYESRKYIQERSRCNESIDFSLGEISRLLLSASTFEMAGADSNLTKFEVPEAIASDIRRRVFD